MLQQLAADATDAGEVMGQVLQWGPAGVVIVLILTGVLVTRGQMQQMQADRDQWKAAYERECNAHDTTRTALVEANRGSAASIETARTATALLSNLGHVAARTPEQAA
jgi:hypothetical protein